MDSWGDKKTMIKKTKQEEKKNHRALLRLKKRVVFPTCTANKKTSSTVPRMKETRQLRRPSPHSTRPPSCHNPQPPLPSYPQENVYLTAQARRHRPLSFSTNDTYLHCHPVEHISPPRPLGAPAPTAASATATATTTAAMAAAGVAAAGVAAAAARVNGSGSRVLLPLLHVYLGDHALQAPCARS